MQSGEGVVASGDPAGGFHTKQTPLDARGGDHTPSRAEEFHPTTERPIVIEGDGPEAMMKGLRQEDAAERRHGVAQARAETELNYVQVTEHEAE